MFQLGIRAQLRQQSPACNPVQSPVINLAGCRRQSLPCIQLQLPRRFQHFGRPENQVQFRLLNPVSCQLNILLEIRARGPHSDHP